MLVENAAKEEKTILNKLKIYRRPEQPRVERFISSVSLWWRVKFDLFSWEKEVRTRTSVASPVRMPCMLARHSWRNKHEAVSNNREKPFHGWWQKLILISRKQVKFISLSLEHRGKTFDPATVRGFKHSHNTVFKCSSHKQTVSSVKPETTTSNQTLNKEEMKPQIISNDSKQYD